MVGLPSIWGGDDPIRGYDCSGLVVEALKFMGHLTENEDYNSAGLWEKFRHCEVASPREGDIIFADFDNDGVPDHTEFYIGGGKNLAARGSHRGIKTREDAIRENAFVAGRPLSRLKNWRAISIC